MYRGGGRSPVSHPPFLNAGNAGRFTLDGTRTYRVGVEDVALVDPGPLVPEHVEALAAWVEGARTVRILLTHRHGDHADAARPLAELVGAEVLGPQGGEDVDRSLADGDRVATDEGELVAVSTPGHARHHLSFHWPGRSALFAGDLVLGRGDTTWVAEYPGCVADYLRSLARLGALDLDVIYPAHGPPLTDVPAALRRFEQHRRARVRQVQRALDEDPSANLEDLVARVYGDTIPPEMIGAAKRSVAALVEFVADAMEG